jgi:hypothetical protein
LEQRHLDKFHLELGGGDIHDLHPTCSLSNVTRERRHPTSRSESASPEEDDIENIMEVGDRDCLGD